MRLNIDLTQGKVKPNVFFTSDFHLFHKNALRFDNRPFTDVNEMHQVIEDRWNETVNDGDYVIYLGDLSFARREEQNEVEGMLWRLKGKIHFVMGNHDKWEDIKKLPKLESVQDYLEVRIGRMEDDGKGTLVKRETLFTCMHYPIYSWNKSHHGSYHVHGHCHGNLHHGEDAIYYVNRRAIDVGCMLHDYHPISYLDVIEKLKEVKLPILESKNN